MYRYKMIMKKNGTNNKILKMVQNSTPRFRSRTKISKAMLNYQMFFSHK